MEKNFNLEIISPEKIILSEKVNSVTMPSFEGEMTILPDHIPLITFLRPGILRIEGHTDNQMVGFSRTFKSNFDLSAARAASVADFLVGETSLQNGRLTISGLADTKPIGDNATALGRAKNRRIEIEIDF